MNASSPTSIYHPVSKQDIVCEYTLAGAHPEDYQRAKWGTRAGMTNRFRLGLSLVDWSGVRRWLDVGCGEGLFFAMAESDRGLFDELVGVDITPCVLQRARRLKYASPARFIEADLETMPADLTGFDLVTLVGVLQQCGAAPHDALAACCTRLRPGGQLFLTTKNIAWEAFIGGRLSPEPGHSWFDPQAMTEALRQSGVTPLHMGGFLPRSGRIVEIQQSHTMFIVGRRSW